MLFLSSALASWAASFAVKVIEKEPPKEVDDSIRKVLQAKAVQLLDNGQPVFEFWFRTEIPLKSNPQSAAKALEAIAETTLCGLVAVRRTEHDYKDNEITEGLYTARFSLQPQDGDHMGTSEFPYYLLLIPLKHDPQLTSIAAYKPMVRASGKATASGHPVVLSLRPAASDASDLPKLNEPIPDHKTVQLKVPARAPKSDAPTSMVFELVYQGKGKT
jgi:hypothetical protein